MKRVLKPVYPHINIVYECSYVDDYNEKLSDLFTGIGYIYDKTYGVYKPKGVNLNI